jgi:hypothetical protein
MRIAWRTRACSIALSLLLTLLGTLAPAAAQTPAWPHTVTVEGASATIYQPQAISWPDHETLTARAAIALRPKDAAGETLGTIELTVRTRTDANTNMVVLSNPVLVSSRFPTLDTNQAEQIDQRIRKALPEIQLRPVPLQSILLSLKERSEAASVPVDNAPPQIFYSDRAASLVVFDGEPVMAPVGKTGLSYAVNTNWDVLTDGKSWFLLNNGLWLTAPAFGGPWTPTPTLPRAFNSVPAGQNFEAVRKAVPPSNQKPPVVPQIFVSTKPAEIIVTNGPPQLVAVPGTGLQSVKNTISSLFLDTVTGDFYLLVSGRWFSSHGLAGPWGFASDKLPADFALIPPDTPQGAVRASVPGTSEAQLAVLQAQVPKQATLKKDQAKIVVTYAGAPQFKPIPGTPLTYAINTGFAVIGADGRYYVCYQGAWFVGATPQGPWILAETVPAVIYTIPPTSPVYYVTYVKVYGTSPATVTFGYTSGYTMGFVSAGVVVYGTGYYYPPVVIAAPVPIYYPYPYSYAGTVTYNTTTGAWTRSDTIYGPYNTASGKSYYNPNTGAWAGGGAIYGPNGGVGAFSAYNPSTGSYAHGSASWGPDGGSGSASWYNGKTGATGSTNQNWNAYSRWGSSTINGPDQTVHTQSGSNSQGKAGSFSSSTGAEGAGYKGAGGNQGGAVKTQNGDIYAGHDGNAYQHTSDGWSKWSNGGWQPVTPPTPPNGGGRNSNTLGSTQQPQQQPSQSQRTAQQQGHQQPGQQQRQTRLGQGGTRAMMEPSSFQQLEQDRAARLQGMQGRFGGGGSGRRFR